MNTKNYLSLILAAVLLSGCGASGTSSASTESVAHGSSASSVEEEISVIDSSSEITEEDPEEEFEYVPVPELLQIGDYLLVLPEDWYNMGSSLYRLADTAYCEFAVFNNGSAADSMTEEQLLSEEVSSGMINNMAAQFGDPEITGKEIIKYNDVSMVSAGIHGTVQDYTGTMYVHIFVNPSDNHLLSVSYFQEDDADTDHYPEAENVISNIELTSATTEKGKELALLYAKSFLGLSPYTYDRLVTALEAEGFTSEEAVYGVENCRADWKKQAVRAADDCLESDFYSRKTMTEKLKAQGFSNDEAAYGAENCHADWNDQAVRYAQYEMKYDTYSRTGMIERLEKQGFTKEEAEYGADHCGADWKELALEQAKSSIDFSPRSHDGLIDHLEYFGFTAEEAEYGADNCGADWKEQAVRYAEDYIRNGNSTREKLIRQLTAELFTAEEAEYAADQVI